MDARNLRDGSEREGAETRDSGRGLPGRIVVLGISIGLAGGALIGAAVGARATKSYDATTIVSVLPDDALTTNQVTGTSSAQDPSGFIQGELVVITSRPILSSVQTSLALTALPTVTARQSGTTDVVEITASAPTQSRAIAVANATRDVYAQRRSQELTRDIATAQSAVQKQIAAVVSQLNNPRVATVTGNANALQQEYARLLAVKSQLDLAAPQTTHAVTTIQNAIPVAAGLSKTWSYGLGGAVLGVLLAAAGLFVVRRARPLVRDTDDLRGFGAEVVVPGFSRSGRRAPNVARLLAARLQEPSADSGNLIGLIGARQQADATGVATAMAESLASQGHVLLISDTQRVSRLRQVLPAHAEVLPFAELSDLAAAVSDPQRRSRHETGSNIHVLDASREELRAGIAAGFFTAIARGGWFVIADMPPLGQSDIGFVLARAVGRATLVVVRGRTSKLEVLSAVEALHGAGVRPVRLLLSDPPRRETQTDRNTSVARWRRLSRDSGRGSRVQPEAAQTTGSDDRQDPVHTRIPQIPQTVPDPVFPSAESLAGESAAIAARSSRDRRS